MKEDPDNKHNLMSTYQRFSYFILKDLAHNHHSRKGRTREQIHLTIPNIRIAEGIANKNTPKSSLPLWSVQPWVTRESSWKVLEINIKRFVRNRI